MYAGLAGIARGAVIGAAGDANVDGAGDAGGAVDPSEVAEVNAAPQYRQNREVSLFIVPHASQRIRQSRARITEARALNFRSKLGDSTN